MTRFSLHHGDCVDWLRSLDDESVALCVTDPAYESLEKHRAKGTTTRLKVSDASSNEWFAIFKNERFPELLAELYRVLAKDAHLYVICDQETAFDVVKPMGIAAGFTWWKALVWDKKKIGMGYHYRARFEHVCFLEKGKRRLADLGIPDVLEHERVPNWAPCACAGDGLCQDTSTPRDTSRSSPKAERSSSTDSCGKRPTARFPQDTTSTTSTGTSSTTRSRTSSASRGSHTSASTVDVSSETGCGGNRALDAASASPSDESTGTWIAPDDLRSWGGASDATSEPSSSASAGSAPLCSRCGQPRRRSWPTEKPVGLMRTLIEQSSSPGELVIDPFNGSGSCGEAALRCGRLYAGADVAAGAIASSRARLARHGTGAVTRARRAPAQGDLFGALAQADHRGPGEPHESPTKQGDEADHQGAEFATVRAGEPAADCEPAAINHEGGEG